MSYLDAYAMAVVLYGEPTPRQIADAWAVMLSLRADLDRALVQDEAEQAARADFPGTNAFRFSGRVLPF